MATIGSKVKSLRLERGMTLQQVADGAECTAAYISQLEHDKTSPSIATLKKVAHILGVRIVDFFLDEASEDAVVLEPDQWPTVSLPRWRAEIKQMTRGVATRKMQPFYTVIAPGGGTAEVYSHQGEEFGLVLEGVMTLQVGAESYEVKAGSSFYYSSSLPHAWTNRGEEPVRVIWIVTPPTW
jgi:transcriptional regulator with XRE-family HTH domain